jgi:hypothetical protein
MVDVAKIIDENTRRREIQYQEYNPLDGIGSPLERQELSFSDLPTMYLPLSFFNDPRSKQLISCRSISEYAKRGGFKSDDDAFLNYIQLRCDHDFEFFAAYALKIEHKETGELFNFILRKAQRKLLLALESMRLAGLPIRIVLLKARQWGGSTLVQMYMFWIQQRLKKNWHISVCAQVDDAAKNIRSMYETSVKHYPSELGIITLKPHAKSSKNIKCVETGGIIGVGSVENPDQFRSYSSKMAHLSEVGVWKSTPKMSGAYVASSLKNTIANVPLSLVVEESTARGVGNYFHDQWLAAVNGTSRYTPVFVPWFEIDMYESDITDYPLFIQGMNEYDRFLWGKGATLENIKWYNEYKAGENKTDIEMNEEYPSTPEEAFISSGSRVYPHQYVSNARETVVKPIFIGDVHTPTMKGKQSLVDIKLIESVTGTLKVWSMPETIVEIEGKKYRVANRYCGFGDFGGTSKTADFTALSIIDRYWMLLGGLPEKAAEYHTHLDPFIAAWRFAQISTLYDNALLALESNTPDQDKNKEGNHFLTAINQLAGVYPNLYVRNNHESINQGFIPKYGFHTNTVTKTMIVDRHKNAMRDKEYVERSIEACDEFDFFENTPDGKMEAQKGKKDDLVIVTAGSVWMALEYMPPVKLIEIVESGKSKSYKRIISEATI